MLPRELMLLWDLVANIGCIAGHRSNSYANHNELCDCAILPLRGAPPWAAIPKQPQPTQHQHSQTNTDHHASRVPSKMATTHTHGSQVTAPRRNKLLVAINSQHTLLLACLRRRTLPPLINPKPDKVKTWVERQRGWALVAEAARAGEQISPGSHPSRV